MNKVLASPNNMVWQYFQALCRLCYRIDSNQNKTELQQDAALCVILAVTGVEVFMNVYFRILVSEKPYEHAKERILQDLENQIALDQKIKEWPLVVFGMKINFGSGVGQQFIDLKNLRNELVHFSSTHETIELPGVTIHGLADTSVYSLLNANTPSKSLKVAEQFICDIFRLRGIEEENICHALHSWTGRVPTAGELTSSSADAL